MNLSIRKFHENDRSQVIRLWKKTFPNDPPWNDPEAVINRKLQIQKDLFLVGLLKKRIVATVLAGYDGFRGWIYHLAVDEDRRRVGIGEMMMTEAEKNLRLWGCIKINLQIRSTNTGVIRFYQRIGYKIEDHVSMGKLLTSDFKK